MLEVDQENIRYRKCLLQVFLRNKKTAVQCRMDVVFFQRTQEIQRKSTLHQRFAAGNSYAAAGLPVEIGIFKGDRQSFVKTERLAVEFQSVAGTDRFASSAGGTFSGKMTVYAVDHDLGLLLADGNAVAAVDAAMRVACHDGRMRDRFGVMTPDTFQRTAFQKKGGADTRSVVNGEPFDVGDDRVFRGVLHLLLPVQDNCFVLRC